MSWPRRETSTVLGGAVFVHPAERWTLLAGPGVEFADGDFTLAPAAWVDVGGGASVFLGLVFSFRL